MLVRYRRCVAHAVVAVVVAAAMAGCNASRPSAGPSTTNDSPGPPVEPADVESSLGPTTIASTAGTTGAAQSAPTQPLTPTPGSITGTTTTAPADEPPAATTFPGTAPAGTLARPSEAEWLAFDSYLQDRLLTSGDYAFGVAVSIDGDSVHAASYGDRNTPDPVPAPPEDESTTDPSVSTTSTTTTTTLPPPPLDPVAVTDRFRVASLSKVITGTVVLQLVEDGALGLNQPVGGLLGDALGVDVSGRPAEEITVRQLLGHTTGFNPFQNTFFRRGVETCREAGARGLREGLQFDPGTTYEYSNMNYCLLGILIEEVTGEPYEEVVYARLLTPLGITGMRLAGTFDPRPDEVIHPSVPTRNYMETLASAGGWVATPANIVTIVDSLDNAKPGFHPLSDETTALMRRPTSGVSYNDPLQQWYGLATIAYSNQSWGHTGTIENTHAMVVHRPDGMTWSILVSGNYPEETGDLAEIFQDAIDNAGIVAPAPTSSTTTTTSTTTTSTLPPSSTSPLTSAVTTTSVR